MPTRFVITCSQSFAADQQTAIRRVPQERFFTARPAKPAAPARWKAGVFDLRKRILENICRVACSLAHDVWIVLGGGIPGQALGCWSDSITRNARKLS
jgi:hypothetical protein